MKVYSATALVATLVLGPGLAVATETPAYRVIADHGAIEIRDYAAMVAVETVVESEFERAGNRAFRRLFDYISGANAGGTKIAMTAPVTQEIAAETASPVELESGRHGWRIAFILPASFSFETAPEPVDERVQLRRIPARRMAAIRFSGSWRPERFEQHRQELLDLAAANGWVVAGELTYARYNAPFTPTFMRRNEVMAPVTKLDSP